MDDGDNFHKFICIILDCINNDNKIFSYSNSKFYFKELIAGDNLYSTFTNEEYNRDKYSLNIVIDNLLKYQKYFNIQSLPKYEIKDKKIDLQITIPNIFKCIQESFDVENWYYDRMRNRKEEMNKRYVNYPSIGIINNKELMNRTFFGGDHSDDSIIENDIILNTRYYSSYDLLLVNVLINFCYILNDGYYLSPNILTMFLLSKIHYLIGKYYIINCKYYKTIKMLDQKTLDLFLVNDTTDNYLTYYQKELLQLFNYKFKNTLVDDFNCRNLIAYDRIIQIPKIYSLIYYYYRDDQNTLESNKNYLNDNKSLLNDAINGILYDYDVFKPLRDIITDYYIYFIYKTKEYSEKIKEDIQKLKDEHLVTQKMYNFIVNNVTDKKIEYNSLFKIVDSVYNNIQNNKNVDNKYKKKYINYRNNTQYFNYL